MLPPVFFLGGGEPGGKKSEAKALDLPDSNQEPKDYLSVIDQRPKDYPFDRIQSSALPTELRSDRVHHG